MTAIDDAPERDRAIVDVDWHVFPPGTEHDVFAARSGGLARVRLGDPDAPRVVLVSGVAGSKEDFILLFPLFAAAGYRVESYDIAGHWESVAAGPQHLDPPREHTTIACSSTTSSRSSRTGAAPRTSSATASPGSSPSWRWSSAPTSSPA